jgi:apoptosis-inducing factor 2
MLIFPCYYFTSLSDLDFLQWNLASVRVVVPDIIPVDSTFFSIPKAHSKYPAEKFEFVLGKAQMIDPTGKSITVRMNNGGSRDISYHTLIVATGSRAKDNMPWKSLETSEKTREAIAALRSRIDSAKSIVIGGAGATGVELAGELGAAYGRNKTVTVICPSKLPLVGLSESTRSAALKELEKLGVTVVTDAKVTNQKEINGSKRLELTHGNQSKTTIEADEFIPTYGIEYNTEFAPESWKDSDGRLKVDATLRQPSFPNVFIVGDAANAQPPTAGKLMDQLTYMKKQLVPYLKGETITDYVKDDSIGVAIAIGPNRGTGQAGKWRLFSLLVWWFKSRTLGLDMAGKAAEGLNL